MKLKEMPLRTVCVSCSLEAQRVESVLEERQYGEQLAIVIVARIFTHVYENGNKKTCRENLEYPWMFTLCSMEEAGVARANFQRMMAKQQVIAGMRVF